MEAGRDRPLCRQLLRLFTCIAHLRHCPLSEADASSVPPCRKLCELAEMHCDIGEGLFDKCYTLPKEECSLEIPSGYFLLEEDEGSFFPVLPIFYIVIASLWGLGLLVWVISNYCWMGLNVLSISRAATIIPITKAPVVALTAIFWYRCELNGMCNFWLSIAILNTQLIHETLSMTVLLMGATGYCIVSSRLTQDDWRGIIVHMTMFYCGSSIFLILWRATLSSLGVLIYILILYGLPLQQLLRSSWRTLRHAAFIESLVPTDARPVFRQPVRERANMFRIFVLLGFLYVITLAAEHTALYMGADIVISLIIGEVAFLVIIFTLGYLYRPRRFSPYFFMDAVRSGQETEEEDRQIPPIFEMLGPGDDADGDSVVKKSAVGSTASDLDDNSALRFSGKTSAGSRFSWKPHFGRRSRSRIGEETEDHKTHAEYHEIELSGAKAEDAPKPQENLSLTLPYTTEEFFAPSLNQDALVVENPDGEIEFLVKQAPPPQQPRGRA